MVNRTNTTVIKVLYVVTMAISFTTRYADFSMKNNHLQIYIGMFWILVSFAQLAINGFRFKNNINREIPFFLKIYFLPAILIHLYTIILIIIGVVPKAYLRTNVSTYIPVLVAIFSIYLFGYDAWKYNFIALIGSWSLAVFVSLLIKGPLIFPHAIVQAYIDPYDKMGGFIYNYLELHDVVLAIGYVLVYYIFSKEKLTRKNLFFIIATLNVMVLGMKRISVLAIILAAFFHCVVKRFSDKKQYCICKIAGWAAFILCFVYIYVLTDGSTFFDYMSSLGVNVMGRNYYFSAIASKIRFTPTFLGLGRHAVAQLFSGELSYMNVGGVHNDILKMYAENGFIVFSAWLLYYLVYILKKYKEHFDSKAALIYFGATIYAFTLYLTDNTEVYFICQIFLILIPACNALKSKYCFEAFTTEGD